MELLLAQGGDDLAFHVFGCLTQLQDILSTNAVSRDWHGAPTRPRREDTRRPSIGPN